MLIAEVHDWMLTLGARYGVNPIIFGTIYIGAIPFFLLSIGLACATRPRSPFNDRAVAFRRILVRVRLSLFSHCWA